MNDDVQEKPAAPDVHALAEAAGTLVDGDGKAINPPPGDVNDEPAVIGPPIEDAPQPGIHVFDQESDPATVAAVAEAEPAAVVPLVFEDPKPSRDQRDIDSGLIWDVRDENRPSVIASAADLAKRAEEAKPYVDLIKAAESFEAHSVLHTPFGTFAIDAITAKDLLEALSGDAKPEQLARVDDVYRVGSHGIAHAGYARHEIATSLVMPLSSVLGIEPWPPTKPDVDALAKAKADAAALALTASAALEA